jgi:uncharacterized membrane protein YkvA (DUF1232 family)
MAKDKPRNLMPLLRDGVLRDMVLRLKLIFRLMKDPRVNPLLKLLPLASLVYLAWPIDLIPGVVLPVIGALDDAAILWLGAYLFVELCPDEVVQEHVDYLAGKTTHAEQGDEEIINGEAVELPDED